VSPDTDAYWVGALSMATARAHAFITTGLHDRAAKELGDVLQRLSESPVFDDGLKHELAPYWSEEERVIQ
jgi:hypothetical protein